MRTLLPIALILSSVVSYLFWKVASNMGWHDLFYQGVAVSFVIAATALVIETPKYSIRQRLYYIMLFLSLSNLLDELFFNPKVFEWNEGLFAIIIVIHQVYLYFNARRKQRQCQFLD